MINWFLYFHTYFGWILIESGGQDGIGGKDRQGNNRGLRKKGKKRRNVLKEWDLASLRKNSIPCKHICYYLVGAAKVAQAALRPPYGARRQHLHEGWAGEGKLQLLWPAFPQGLLHYHNVVREHNGCGVNWHLWCEEESLVSLQWPSTVTFFLSLYLILFFLWVLLYDSF